MLFAGRLGIAHRAAFLSGRTDGRDGGTCGESSLRVAVSVGVLPLRCVFSLLCRLQFAFGNFQFVAVAGLRRRTSFEMLFVFTFFRRKSLSNDTLFRTDRVGGICDLLCAFLPVLRIQSFANGNFPVFDGHGVRQRAHDGIKCLGRKKKDFRRESFLKNIYFR